MEPFERYWLAMGQPDGLYTVPPDVAGQPAGEDEHAADSLLLVSLGVMMGILVLIDILVTVGA